MAFGIVVLTDQNKWLGSWENRLAHVGLACPSTNLWDGEVNTEGGVFVFELARQVIDAFSKHFGAIVYPANDTNSTCVTVFITQPTIGQINTPALVTAAASLGPAATFMPVKIK